MDLSVFIPEVLNLIDDGLIDKFAAGVSMIALLSLALSYPTLVAAPHMFMNSYKNFLDNWMHLTADRVEYLKDPDKIRWIHLIADRVEYLKDLDEIRWIHLIADWVEYLKDPDKIRRMHFIVDWVEHLKDPDKFVVIIILVWFVSNDLGFSLFD